MFAAAGIDGPEQLRGGTVAVDVPGSGFAFALFHLLAGLGLHRDTDYTVVPLGSTPRRAVALRQGDCDATLLNGAATVSAEFAGLTALGRISAVVSPYLGTVIAATGTWLADHEDVGRRFCAAWDQATNALLDEVDSPDIEAMLADEYDLSEQQVPVMQRTLVDRSEGLVRGGVVDEAALRSVLDLRARYGSPEAAAEVQAALDGGLGSSGIVDTRFASA